MTFLVAEKRGKRSGLLLSLFGGGEGRGVCACVRVRGCVCVYDVMILSNSWARQMWTSQGCVQVCMWVGKQQYITTESQFAWIRMGVHVWLTGPTPTAWPSGPSVYYLMTLWTEWETDLLWTDFEEERSRLGASFSLSFMSSIRTAGDVLMPHNCGFCCSLAYSFFSVSLFWVC